MQYRAVKEPKSDALGPRDERLVQAFSPCTGCFALARLRASMRLCPLFLGKSVTLGWSVRLPLVVLVRQGVVAPLKLGLSLHHNDVLTCRPRRRFILLLVACAVTVARARRLCILSVALI
jgi:hypothetical protein